MMRTGVEKVIAVKPYEALASIYDQVMIHVNYKYWAQYIQALLEKYAGGAHWIVDLSCGTGSCCAFLHQLGYKITGMDASPSMIRQARRKNYPPAVAESLFCGDMMRPYLHRRPPVMISLYDSMNYLLDDRHWQWCLTNVYDSLEDGGLFIFDVSTIYNSQHDFCAYHEEQSVAGGWYSRHSTFNRENQLQRNNFRIKLAGQTKVIYEEMHVQVIRSLSNVIDFINASPLELVAAFKDFSFEPFTERCERVHFITAKMRQP